MSLRSLARIAVVAIAAAFFIGRLGEFYWLFDLFSHFRPHYAALLLVGTVVLASFRDLIGASAALLLAVFVGWPVLQDLSTPAPHATQADQPALRVLTLNAWFRNKDMARIAQVIESSQADVVVVQELDREGMQPLLALLKSYPYSAMQAAQNRHGAAIVSRWPIASAEAIELDGSHVDAQLASIQWRGQVVDVLGVHLTWPVTQEHATARNAQWQALAEWMKQRKGAWVAAGDLNLTPWSPIFEHANGVQHCFDTRRHIGTWPAWIAPAGIQIDHCFASREWDISTTELLEPIGSDHRPVLMRATLRSAPMH